MNLDYTNYGSMANNLSGVMTRIKLRRCRGTVNKEREVCHRWHRGTTGTACKRWMMKSYFVRSCVIGYEQQPIYSLAIVYCSYRSLYSFFRFDLFVRERHTTSVFSESEMNTRPRNKICYGCHKVIIKLSKINEVEVWRQPMPVSYTHLDVYKRQVYIKDEYQYNKLSNLKLSTVWKSVHRT